MWKILARHKWVSGATISESVSTTTGARRYSATIRGWRNWRIFKCEADELGDMKSRVETIVNRVNEIKRRIDEGDQSVFQEKGAW
jgi:hypothetical protein